MKHLAIWVYQPNKVKYSSWIPRISIVHFWFPQFRLVWCTLPESNSSHLKRWRAPKGKDRLPPFSGDQKARPSLYYRVFFGYLPGNDERYPPPSNFSRFFFPFPQVGYGLVRSRYLQGIIPFGPSLPLGGGAAAAAIGTGDGGWGLPNAMEEIWPGNQCGIFIIPTGAMISSINSISGWWMTHNDTSRRQINVWCFCCTQQGGVCCDEHMRLSDNKFSKLNGGMSNLLGFGQPGKCGCLKSLFIEIYMILDAYMASHGYCPARSYTGSRWMIEMAFIKVHDGLKLATDQDLNSPHVCHVLMVTAARLAQDCPTLGAI